MLGNDSPRYPEKELFAAISKGDEAAFTELFRRYDKRFYFFALKMIHDPVIAEDLTQEIFIKIWENRRILDTVNNPEAYLLTTAANHALNQIKKNLSEQKMLKRLAAYSRENFISNTDERLLLHDQEALLQQALERLPKQQKRVYHLSRLSGLNYEEIAGILKISPHTVRNHLVEALRSIRCYLEEEKLLSAFIACTVLLLEN
ncbi:MAG: RNA polymerase sigma-70 factor [Bacteroidota bacterium]|nr:RNA polymerase sigma-70 factor [Bacteroidota bacterium]